MSDFFRNPPYLPDNRSWNELSNSCNVPERGLPQPQQPLFVQIQVNSREEGHPQTRAISFTSENVEETVVESNDSETNLLTRFQNVRRRKYDGCSEVNTKFMRLDDSSMQNTLKKKVRHHHNGKRRNGILQSKHNTSFRKKSINRQCQSKGSSTKMSSPSSSSSSSSSSTTTTSLSLSGNLFSSSSLSGYKYGLSSGYGSMSSNTDDYKMISSKGSSTKMSSSSSSTTTTTSSLSEELISSQPSSGYRYGFSSGYNSMSSNTDDYKMISSNNTGYGILPENSLVRQVRANCKDLKNQSSDCSEQDNQRKENISDTTCTSTNLHWDVTSNKGSKRGRQKQKINSKKTSKRIRKESRYKRRRNPKMTKQKLWAINSALTESIINDLLRRMSPSREDFLSLTYKAYSDAECLITSWLEKIFVISSGKQSLAIRECEWNTVRGYVKKVRNIWMAKSCHNNGFLFLNPSGKPFT